MTNKTLPQNQNTRKVEAEKLLEQANKQLGKALKAYQQALDIYQDIGDKQVVTLISDLISHTKIPNLHSTNKSAESNHPSVISEILANPPIVDDNSK